MTLHRFPALFVFAAMLASAGPALAERSYKMTFEGRDFTIKRVPAEPLGPAFGLPAAGSERFPALRIGNAADPEQALRAVEAFCGLDPGAMKDFGAYGDPFLQDRRSGEWVIWVDCVPGSGKAG